MEDERSPDREKHRRKGIMIASPVPRLMLMERRVSMGPLLPVRRRNVTSTHCRTLPCRGNAARMACEHDRCVGKDWNPGV
jgi:hypothetical protein